MCVKEQEYGISESKEVRSVQACGKSEKNDNCKCGKEKHAGKNQNGEERNLRRLLVRLCEIKTRFTRSFYCGYGFLFLFLWTRGTVPFNRGSTNTQFPNSLVGNTTLVFFLTTIFRFLLFSSCISYFHSFLVSCRFRSINKTILSGLL